MIKQAPANILIVDDQEDIRSLIGDILGDEGFIAKTAANSQDAEVIIKEKMPDLVILDIWLEDSDKDGMQMLKDITSVSRDTPVIMISGHGNIETAVTAIQLGAYDFIEKPFTGDKLLVLVDRALEAFHLKKENRELRLAALGSVFELDGKSALLQQTRQNIKKVAATNSRILITGEAGTGKGVAARMIHMHSKRADENYVVLNCALLSPEGIEEELFGKEENHVVLKRGVLEQANGGTLFLDEVADMPIETQAKIVRVLQDQHFKRLGGSDRIDLDVRVIASTNQDLQALMIEGKFRQDLFYRLSVVPIDMPPLRDRLEDIPVLAKKFMDMAAKSAEIPPRIFSEDAVALMQSYDWPGNVRQLRNIIEWVLIMAGGNAREPITSDMMPPDLQQQAVDMIRGREGVELMSKPLREAREIFEREYLVSQVNRFGGNISKTAVFVGMERSALHRKLKSLGVNTSDKDNDNETEDEHEHETGHETDAVKG